MELGEPDASGRRRPIAKEDLTSQLKQEQLLLLLDKVQTH